MSKSRWRGGVFAALGLSILALTFLVPFLLHHHHHTTVASQHILKTTDKDLASHKALNSTASAFTEMKSQQQAFSLKSTSPSATNKTHVSKPSTTTTTTTTTTTATASGTKYQSAQKYKGLIAKLDALLMNMTYEGIPHRSLHEAVKLQTKTSVRDLGLCFEDSAGNCVGADTPDSDPARHAAFINWLAAQESAKKAKGALRAAMVCLWVGPHATVRSNVFPWIQYHLEAGISHFYLGYDGSDPATLQLLRSVKVVTVLPFRPELATPAELKTLGQRNVRIGNQGLMDKQSTVVSWGIREAQRLGIEWIFHVDVDEAIYSYHSSGRVDRVLSALPPSTLAVRMMNHEAQLEAGDVTDRMRQVTLFRSHHEFVPSESFGPRWYLNFWDGPFEILYANGKSGARTNVPGVHPYGPHYFMGKNRTQYERGTEVSKDLAVLHFPYTSISEIRHKADRTNCPKEILDLALASDPWNTTYLSKCIILHFDRDALLIAENEKRGAPGSTQRLEDFFWSRLVLSEGAVVRCPQNRRRFCNLEHVRDQIIPLATRAGILQRITLVSQILRSHDRLMQFWLAGMLDRPRGGGRSAMSTHSRGGGHPHPHTARLHGAAGAGAVSTQGAAAGSSSVTETSDPGAQDAAAAAATALGEGEGARHRGHGLVDREAEAEEAAAAAAATAADREALTKKAMAMARAALREMKTEYSTANIAQSTHPVEGAGG